MIYVACPVSCDAAFVEKRAILRELAVLHAIRFYLPLEHGTPSQEATLLSIRDSDAFIGDLTGERPSVYFELGQAVAISKTVRLLAEKGTRIHQCGELDVQFYEDLGSYRRCIESVIIAT